MAEPGPWLSYVVGYAIPPFGDGVPTYVYRGEAVNSAIKMAGTEVGLFKEKLRIRLRCLTSLPLRLCRLRTCPVIPSRSILPMGWLRAIRFGERIIQWREEETLPEV